MIRNIKVNDILKALNKIVIYDDKLTVLDKGTVLKVVAVSSSGDRVIVNRYYNPTMGNIALLDIDEENFNIIAHDVAFDVNDVVKCTDLFIADYKDKNENKVSLPIVAGTLIAIRGITEQGKYLGTIMNTNFKGFNINFNIDGAVYDLKFVNNTLSINWVDEENGKRVQKTQKLKNTGNSCSQQEFKCGDKVIYYKTYKEGAIPYYFNSQMTFIAYLKIPVYADKTGIPLDSIYKTKKDGYILGNSRCFKRSKDNEPTKAFFIDAMVKDNKLTFHQFALEDCISEELKGEAKCNSKDKFDFKTGLLLAIARAYEDRSLEEYILKNI